MPRGLTQSPFTDNIQRTIHTHEENTRLRELADSFSTTNPEPASGPSLTSMLNTGHEARSATRRSNESILRSLGAGASTPQPVRERAVPIPVMERVTYFRCEGPRSLIRDMEHIHNILSNMPSAEERTEEETDDLIYQITEYLMSEREDERPTVASPDEIPRDWITTGTSSLDVIWEDSVVEVDDSF